MYIKNLVIYIIGLTIFIAFFIIISIQLLVNKKIFLKNGESKSLNELNFFKKLQLFMSWLLILVFFIIFTLSSVPYIKDFSIYKNKKFQVIDHHNVEDIKHSENATRASSYTIVTINGIDYKATNNTPIQQGDTVKIVYLPNTKIIVDFEIY